MQITHSKAQGHGKKASVLCFVYGDALIMIVGREDELYENNVFCDPVFKNMHRRFTLWRRSDHICCRYNDGTP